MSNPLIEVLAVGQASYDISFYVDEFPRENSKLETQVTMEQGGGPAANAAYLLSKWGTRCAFAGLIGDDVYGRRILDEFQAVGTDLSLSPPVAGLATAVSMVLVNRKTGTRTIVNCKDATRSLQLNLSSLRSMTPKVLLFDGHELEASLLALDAFPTSASILDAGSLRPGTEALAAKVKFLVASERFALQVSGLADLASDSAQRECFCSLRAVAREDAVIVVTTGARGLIYEESPGTCRHVAACSVHPIDTTGAGDIFHGAFAYGVLRCFSLSETLKLATMAAGLSVERLGGRFSTPTLASVEEGLDHP